MPDEQTIEVEGQHFGFSDENLKQAVQQVEDAIAALQKLRVKSTAEVEGQLSGFSDENLKQAIEQVESALASLRKLQGAARSAAQVEGQMRGA
jgi:hypothetical protein